MEANTEVTPPRSPAPEVTPRPAQVTEPRLVEVTRRPREVTGLPLEVTELRVTVMVKRIKPRENVENIMTYCDIRLQCRGPGVCVSAGAGAGGRRRSSGRPPSPWSPRPPRAPRDPRIRNTFPRHNHRHTSRTVRSL